MDTGTLVRKASGLGANLRFAEPNAPLTHASQALSADVRWAAGVAETPCASGGAGHGSGWIDDFALARDVGALVSTGLWIEEVAGSDGEAEVDGVFAARAKRDEELTNAALTSVAR